MMMKALMIAKSKLKRERYVKFEGGGEKLAVQSLLPGERRARFISNVQNACPRNIKF